MEWLVLYRGATLETAELVTQSTDAALLAVVRAYLTVHAPVERLRQCPACQTLFVVRSGKQRYCSRACVNRVSVRTWRATPAHREAANQRARARYAARRVARNGQEG